MVAIEKEKLYDIIMSRLPRSKFEKLTYSKKGDTETWASKSGLFALACGEKWFEHDNYVILHGKGDGPIDICYMEGNNPETQVDTINKASHIEVSEYAMRRPRILYNSNITYLRSGAIVKEADSNVIRCLDDHHNLISGDYHQYPNYWKADEDAWKYIVNRLRDDMNAKVV